MEKWVHFPNLYSLPRYKFVPHSLACNWLIAHVTIQSRPLPFLSMSSYSLPQKPFTSFLSLVISAFCALGKFCLPMNFVFLDPSLSCFPKSLSFLSCFQYLSLWLGIVQVPLPLSKVTHQLLSICLSNVPLIYSDQ